MSRKLSFIKTVQVRYGAKWWLDGELGKIGELPRGAGPRMAPRLDVIADVCQTAFSATLWLVGFFAFAPIVYVASVTYALINQHYDFVFGASCIVPGLILIPYTVILANVLVATLRLSMLPSVIASPSVGGIHFVPRRTKPAAQQEEPQATVQQEANDDQPREKNPLVDGFKSMLRGQG